MAIRSARRPTYRPIVSTDTRLRDTQITQDRILLIKVEKFYQLLKNHGKEA